MPGKQLSQAIKSLQRSPGRQGVRIKRFECGFHFPNQCAVGRRLRFSGCADFNRARREERKLCLRRSTTGFASGSVALGFERFEVAARLSDHFGGTPASAATCNP